MSLCLTRASGASLARASLYYCTMWLVDWLFTVSATWKVAYAPAYNIKAIAFALIPRRTH